MNEFISTANEQPKPLTPEQRRERFARAGQEAAAWAAIFNQAAEEDTIVPELDGAADRVLALLSGITSPKSENTPPVPEAAHDALRKESEPQLASLQLLGEDRLKEVSAIRMDGLDLPARALTGLSRAGINTVGDLLSLTYEELLSIKNNVNTSGIALRAELRRKLSPFGVTLPRSNPNHGDSPQISINDLDTSVTLYNVLALRGIKTVEDLLPYSYEQILRWRFMGPTYVNELKTILGELGVTLPDK
jgi:DNA-directed RNA polymerase alpha subunit